MGGARRADGSPAEAKRQADAGEDDDEADDASDTAAAARAVTPDDRLGEPVIRHHVAELALEHCLEIEVIVRTDRHDEPSFLRRRAGPEVAPAPCWPRT